MKIAVTLVMLAVPAWAQAPAASPAPSPTVATVDGEPITHADLESLLGSRLYELRNQEYTLKRRALDEAVARRLFRIEAQRRGVSEEELERVEVKAKVAPVTDEDKRALYEENKARLTGMPEAEALGRAGEFLVQQRERERRVAFVGELRAKSAVKVLLDPPRYEVSVDDDPSRGPADAAVTIVEFSDFECPFCSRAVAVVKQIEERYGKNVRVVFRDLPLTQIHQHAAKAAEAASCAHEHGKFWEFHDVLFANQSALGLEDLKKHAAAVGIPAEPFAACLASGKYEDEWKKDSTAAAAAGVTSTPAFLINGRLLTGAQPLTAFVEVIDEELDRAGLKPPAAPSAH